MTCPHETRAHETRAHETCPHVTRPLVMCPWHCAGGITFDIWCQRQGVQAHLVLSTTFAIAAHQLIHNVNTGCDERDQAQECRIS